MLSKPESDGNAIVNQLFDRLGQYLNPRITDTEIIPASTGKSKVRPLPIRLGVCQRTGLPGPVIDYPSNQGVTVYIPTLARILWIFSYQRIPDRNGKDISQRLGGAQNSVVVMTEHEIMTNVMFTADVPDLKRLKTAEIIRTLAGYSDQPYLFLSFAKSTGEVFKDRFRRSVGPQIEVNGHFAVGKDYTVRNAPLSLRRALELSQSQVPTDVLFKVHRLVIKNERNDFEQKTLLDLVQATPLVAPLLPVLRAAVWQDITLSRMMSA